MKENKREIWIDNIKVIGCILVLLGHFFQGIEKGNIIEGGKVYIWFNTTIYYFHVQLFFICSGYLYQKYSNVTSANKWRSNVKKKFITLGIPYLIFSSITYVFKIMFKESVNTSVGSIWSVIFFHPINQYWYFYVLFFIFVVTYTIKSKKQMYVMILFSVILKLLYVSNGSFECLPLIFKGIVENHIWFALGMGLAYFNIKKSFDLFNGIIVGIIFLILSIYLSLNNIDNKMISFLLGIMACISIIECIYKIFESNNQNYVFKVLSSYTLQIYVLHTIFAAGVRVMLLRLGIVSFWIHLILGVGISIIGPVFVSYILAKSKYGEIFFHPNKIIKIK